MKYALAKWTVDLLAPGAVITPTLTRWYAQWNTPHSRRIVYPVKPILQLLDIRETGSVVLEDFCHIRVAPISEGYDGATDGWMDYALTMVDLDVLLGNDLQRVAATALNLAPKYRAGKTYASWLELFEMDEQTEAVRFVRQVYIDKWFIQPIRFCEAKDAPKS